jgi:hypothetical protein
VLSILTFIVFALAIYLSRDGRWVTVLFAGIGLIAAGFAVIVFRNIAGGIVVDHLVKTQSIKPAAEQAWDIGTSLMISIATTVIVVGVLFAAAGWLASPSGAARSVRRVLAPALQGYMAYVYSGLVILVGIYFLSAPSPGLRSFLTTVIVAGMAAFGLHELRVQTEEEFPGARFSDVFGRTRDRVVSAVKDANLGERASKLRLPEVRMPSSDKGEGDATGAGAEPPTAVILSDDDARLGRLERLAMLREKGLLTEEEFAAEKARVLAEPRA